MPLDRRTFILGAGAAFSATAVAADAVAAVDGPGSFPRNFLWGAATAGHQIEGNNVNSDSWLLENCTPTIFREPSLDAANSFELWATDLDLVKSLGLNSYRFSLEWARIEPEEGLFSIAMLNHYRAVIAGCRDRGLVPVVTFNHFTTPRWFAAQGGWTNPKSPTLFARYCETAARHLGELIGYATTLNEPNVSALLAAFIPRFAKARPRFSAMMAAAANASGSDRFVIANIAPADVTSAMLPNMIAAHKSGRAAIKSVRPSLPVGISMAIADDEAVGSNVKRDQVRADAYGAWLDAAKGDDFIGVQNYERNQWNETDKLPAPPDAPHNYLGAEVYPPSLAGAVRYAHHQTGCPVIVTEHGVGTDDDRIRSALIPAALKELKVAMDEGVPVYGYLHWSLLDNFEWTFGFKPKFGLCAVDRTTFKRTPKPSSAVFGAIARRNALES